MHLYEDRLQQAYEEIMDAHHYEMQLKEMAPSQEAKMLFHEMAKEDMMMAEKIKKLYYHMYKKQLPMHHHEMEMIEDYRSGIDEVFEERIQIYSNLKDLYLMTEDKMARDVLFDVLNRNNIQTMRILYVK